MRYSFILLGIVLLAPAGMSGAQDASTADLTSGVLKGRPYSPNADRGFPDKALFGDTHVHSALSADAGGGGTTLMPRDMYRFAQGEQVRSNTGQPVKMARPFDFYMLTEHTDGMGVITDIMRGAPNIMADEQGNKFHEEFAKGGDAAKKASIDLIAQFSQGTLSEALLYQPGSPGYDNTWRDIVQAAEEFNEPHVFTAMIAYEWTSLVAGNNLHRNVIFRDGPERALQVVPFLMAPPLGSPDPRDLWKWMQNYEDDTGGDVLAIPHNPNLSNGIMFAPNDTFNDGAPFDREYLVTRSRWEKLLEIGQTKGDSETHPLLSPTDEFANYESWDWANLDVSEAKTPEMIPFEYARSILKKGLQFQKDEGVNPFKLGFVGGSDIHTGLTTQDDNNYFGAFTWMEPSETRATTVAKGNEKLDISYKGWQYATPGPTAVWATENTRAGIFDAMERREVYATTGPRITVRFFGGNFSADDIQERDLARIGYSKGVPMGGDLSVQDGEAPSFLVYALRDPIGANLDRVQIVKGWIDADGSQQEKVYDVAWAGERTAGADGKLPPVGNTVDLSVPSWTNDIGRAELGAVWADPDFDASENAFYYARVIEIPTPRWTAYDAVRFGIEMPDEVKMITQERAYTSPIWHTPEG
ncbi:hypothetical protein C1J03_14850 [Sulfitobacter sp. SK012]|uniref:DUF3604 domain-containing protein n=1 Tax=Sulfitobacter sp. SK012 TaxID=1389005 RepID=UPI000E0CA792|nr:DUF3604 domain-containing protein [Sulfitobacter sp. SK012]AXI47178.1 hypothetical protein C1J03_14850 [Sulfitobacter sp. SK012]